MKLIEAEYENGVLRPREPLGLRTGERVNLILVRRPDPARWDLERLAKTGNVDDLALSQLGLEEWAAMLDATERG